MIFNVYLHKKSSVYPYFLIRIVANTG